MLFLFIIIRLDKNIDFLLNKSSATIISPPLLISPNFLISEDSVTKKSSTDTNISSILATQSCHPNPMTLTNLVPPSPKENGNMNAHMDIYAESNIYITGFQKNLFNQIKINDLSQETVSTGLVELSNIIDLTTDSSEGTSENLLRPISTNMSLSESTVTTAHRLNSNLVKIKIERVESEASDVTSSSRNVYSAEAILINTLSFNKIVNCAKGFQFDKKCFICQMKINIC